ncbi:ATP-binding protein [Amycolatopsis sp. NPDC004169]|uniref:ATP-binding protein n=1 Tax=Amycolatopsis sp. NPDC004169 TaxID=3154453 RepID=UPI0033B52009
MEIGVALEVSKRPASALVTVSGALDLAGYGFLRDGLLKVAADGPPRLVADLDALAIGELSPSTVFPFVAKRIAEWPGIPFAVVTRQPQQLDAFHRHGIERFVPVHPDVAAAETAQKTPIRCTARRVLPRVDDATTLARTFVRDHALQWQVPEFIDAGTLVAGELVRNVLEHTTSDPDIRLDLRRRLLSVSVADDSDRPAVLIERADIREPGLGLRIVADAARAWGSSHRWSGGKIVWAVLKSERTES